MKWFWLAAWVATILLYMALATYAQPSFPSTNYNPCGHDPDRWEVREPTTLEEQEYGVGILVFTYYNSPNRCSNTTEMGVYYQSPIYGELRFVMSVKVLGKDHGEKERITLDTSGTPYVSYNPTMLIDDGPEPQVMILYPALY